MLYRTEAAVIGGGPAGVCAALALARQGKHTALITNRPVLGGNSSSEIRVWTRGASGGGNLYAEEMGIWGELKLRNLYMNVEANPVFWDDILLEQVLEEEKLTLFLNTYVSELQMDGAERVQSVTGYQMGSERTIEFQAEVFIDATGDGMLGAMAGVPFVMGKEGRDQYGESFAPDSREKGTFGNTIFFFTRKEKQPVIYRSPSFAYSMEQVEGMLGTGGRIVNETMNGCDYWWFEMGGSADTIADAQEIGLELKRLVAGVWNYIKNSGKYDADYLTLEWEGNLPGKRESRRMITETVLRQQDILERTQFPDSAFYGGWYLDFHPSAGVAAGEDNCIQIPVQVYPIPLSCLYSRKVSNLIFAGRDIGVSHVAFASTRIMNTCALCGQAAGTLAAKCLEDRCVPADLTPDQIRGIQMKLLRDDMMIPGMVCTESVNLAEQASVKVSSSETSGTSPVGTWNQEREMFLVRPAAAGASSFRVRAEQACTLAYREYQSELPSRTAWGDSCSQGTIDLKKGEQWITFPVFNGSDSGRDGFLTAVFEESPGVSFLLGEEELPGFLLGSRDSPVCVNPLVRLDPNHVLYGGENLTNGELRLWRRPNLWVSCKEERPWAELSWGHPVEVGEILVFFNPDLNMELVSSRAETWDAHHKYVPRTAMPSQLVKEARLLGQASDGSWTVIAELHNNWKRRWAVCLKKKELLQTLRLEVLSAYGSKRAEIFEIRVYS